MSNDLSSVSDILDALEELAEQENEVSIGEVTDALGGRGFGPLITLPALLVLTPLGGIPSVPTLMAVVIALFAVQILFQRERMWLPPFLEDRAVSDNRVIKSVKKLRGVATWLDGHLGSRLKALVNPPMPTIAAALVLGMCVMVPPSEIVPFGALVPMGGIALIGLALTLRDGVLMLAGLVFAAGTVLALIGFF